MRCTTLSISLLFVINLLWAQPQVPAGMEYCGINLTFTEESRAYIQQKVNEIHTSPKYFNIMVQKAKVYFPFIEEAFRDEGIPEDLKYLVIQESALKPHAVSTSNAVGFWQFKAPTAIETGLQVNESVDERKHIYKASRAAGKYFAKANRDFNNWIYAIISYYQGPTGAVAHTNPAYYGKDFMVIEGDFHPYALKSIAHKIAYEAAVEKQTGMGNFMMPFATKEESSWKEIITKHNLTEEAFLEVNPWIQELGPIPAGDPYSYYISVPVSRYMGHVDDPVKAPIVASTEPPQESLPPTGSMGSLEYPGNKTRPTPEEPEIEPTYFVDEAQPRDKLPRKRYALFNVVDDLHYPKAYILIQSERELEQIAARIGISMEKLMAWNQLDQWEDKGNPQLIYTTPPTAAPFHIVKAGDRFPEIATLRRISLGKLLRINRLNDGDMALYVGQKLYLKSKRPKEEKLILLDIPNSLEEMVMGSAPSGTERAQIQPKPVTTTLPQPSSSQEMVSRWIKHTVEAGETLWSISQEYGTKVEIIKRINGLAGSELAIGQVLSIMVNEVGAR